MSASDFTGDTFVNIAAPRHLFLPKNLTVVSAEECSFVESVFAVVSKMMDEPAFYTAVNALWSYRQSLRPTVQLAILWAGIESLFGIRSELRFRISLLASKFLGGTAEDYAVTKKLYNERSKAVHEGKIKSTSTVNSTAELLHKLILECIKKKDLPREADILFS